MNDEEAAAVIAALESGRQFTFEAYSADARESLAHDRALDCFVIRRQHAFDPGDHITETFTRAKMAARLKEGFAYGSFGLPSVSADSRPSR